MERIAVGGLRIAWIMHDFLAREALPVPKSGPAGSPEREKARLQAARALAMQARLLCSAARLLDPKRAELAAAFKKLDELDERLNGGGSAPIDDARAQQSACLRELTQTRRPTTQKNPASAATDTLLARLSDVYHHSRAATAVAPSSATMTSNRSRSRV